MIKVINAAATKHTCVICKGTINRGEAYVNDTVLKTVPHTTKFCVFCYMVILRQHITRTKAFLAKLTKLYKGR